MFIRPEATVIDVVSKVINESLRTALESESPTLLAARDFTTRRGRYLVYFFYFLSVF